MASAIGYMEFSISLTQLIKGLYYFSYLYLNITLYCFKGVINRGIYLRCLPIYSFIRV
jgi:hypothetical protein